MIWKYFFLRIFSFFLAKMTTIPPRSMPKIHKSVVFTINFKKTYYRKLKKNETNQNHNLTKQNSLSEVYYMETSLKTK